MGARAQVRKHTTVCRKWCGVNAWLTDDPRYFPRKGKLKNEIYFIYLFTLRLVNFTFQKQDFVLGNVMPQVLKKIFFVCSQFSSHQ